MQYGKVEWAVVVNAQLKDPYNQTEVKLDLRLRQPNHQEILVPAYYERGKNTVESLWRVRFAPKFSGSYSGEFELTTTNGVVHSKTIKLQVDKSNGEGFLHTKNNWACITDSGRLFRGVGYNIGWETRANDDSKMFADLQDSSRYSYEYMLGKLAAEGGNFFRTWCCSWNLPIEFTQPSNLPRYPASTRRFNDAACSKLDELTDLCDRLNLRMMLTVFAGFADWEGSSLNLKNGGTLLNPREFLESPRGRLSAKNSLRYFVARWGYSPSIGAWEFFNEIDNFMYSQTPRVTDSVVADWHREMSTYLKSIDPYNHIVTTSTSHRFVDGLDEVSAIDINQRHIYKSSNGMAGSVINNTMRFHKPIVVGEFSYEWDWTKDFNGIKANMDLDFKQGLWMGAFSPTPILPMSWWWEYFDQHQIESYVGRVARFNNLLLKESGGQIAMREVKPDGTPLYTAVIKTSKARYMLILNRSFKALTESVVLPARITRGLTAYDVETDRLVAFPAISQDKVSMVVNLTAGGGMILRFPIERK